MFSKLRMACDRLEQSNMRKRNCTACCKDDNVFVLQKFKILRQLLHREWKINFCKRCRQNLKFKKKNHFVVWQTMSMKCTFKNVCYTVIFTHLTSHIMDLHVCHCCCHWDVRAWAGFLSQFVVSRMWEDAMDVDGGTFRKSSPLNFVFFRHFLNIRLFLVAIVRTYTLNLPKQMLNVVKTNSAET